MKNLLKNKVFAMDQKALESLMGTDSGDLSLDNVSPIKSKPEIKGGVPTIKIRGPLFKEDNILTRIFGGASYASIGNQLDDLVSLGQSKILLDVDSPGGEVAGCSDLSQKIKNFVNAGIDIKTFVSGDCCSAALWVCSPTEIYTSRTGQIGSVGVVAVIDEGEKNEKEIKIVSSQTPNKNVDPKTSEGRQKIQKKVDSLCSIFMEEVAKNYGKSVESFAFECGSGDIFVGLQAVKKGLAKKITTIEKLKGEIMSKEKEEAQLTVIKEDLVVNERSRVLGILSLKGSEELSNKLIKDGVSVGEAAILFRKQELAIKPKKESYLASITSSEGTLKDITVTTEAKEESVSSILKLATKYGV